MRIKKVGVSLITALLLVLVLLLCMQEMGAETPFCFVAQTQGGAEVIHYWQPYEESHIVYLPSFAELSELRIRTAEPIWLDDVKFTDGDVCSDLELDRPYGLSDGYEYLGTVTFMQSEHMPALYIETASGSMNYIHEVKGNEEAGRMRLYSSDGSLNHGGNVESVNARGNYTFAGVEKKSYSLKLSQEADLLDMGKAKKWILMANYYDSSQMRNKLVYDFAGTVGLSYSPECRWVELFLNGEYAGLYLLSERNEVHPQRVALQNNEGCLVSGEFGHRLDNQKKPYFKTDGGTAFRIHFSTLDARTMEEKFQSAENAVYAPDGMDPVTGKHWTELLDLDSWARKYLIEEIFGNVDGGRASSFCYVDGADGPIFAGPVWDYDFAMSNMYPYREFGDIWYQDTQFQMFYANANPDSWFYPLYRSEIFLSRVVELYAQEFRPLLAELVDSGIGAYEEQIAKAAELNRLYWDERDPAQQAELLRTCLAGRMEFLDRVWLENRDFVTVTARYRDRNVDYILFPGEALPELPQYEDYRWVYTGTQEAVEFSRPILEDIQIDLNMIA